MRVWLEKCRLDMEIYNKKKNVMMGVMFSKLVRAQALDRFQVKSNVDPSPA